MALAITFTDWTRDEAIAEIAYADGSAVYVSCAWDLSRDGFDLTRLTVVEVDEAPFIEGDAIPLQSNLGRAIEAALRNEASGNTFLAEWLRNFTTDNFGTEARTQAHADFLNKQAREVA